jgi:hypothetical protein
VTSPRAVQTSAVKKSVAAIAGAWALRKVRQLVGRDGLGGTPASFSALAIVDSATSWPSFLISPWMRVAPAGVLLGHAHDLFADALHEARPADAGLLRRMRVLGCDQSTMPPQDRVRRDDRRDLGEHLAAEGRALGGQPPALVVGEARPVAELLGEHAALFQEERDRAGLVAMHQPSEHEQNAPERLQGVGHAGRTVSASVWSRPLAHPCRILDLRNLASSQLLHHHHGLGLWRVESDTVETKEHSGRDEGDALVAVDEGVVPGKAVCQCSRKIDQVLGFVGED